MAKPTRRSAAKRAVARHRRDIYTNPFSGFGGSNDVLQRTRFALGPIMDKATVEAMFRFDWAARKVVNIIPEDGTRKWIDFTSDDTDVVKKVNEAMVFFGLRKLFKKAAIYARIYGGAIILIGADDGLDPKLPLNMGNIKEIKFFNIFDRYRLRIDSIYTDPLHPKFGEPKLYTVQPGNRFGRTTNSEHIQVHESRVVRFDGTEVAEDSKQGNDGWGDSIYVATGEPLKRFGTSMQAGGTLIQDFITKVLKMEGLGDLLGTDEGVKKLQARIEFLLASSSMSGVTLTGSDEEYSKIQTPIAGLVKLFEVYEEELSASSSVPRARFFSQQLGTLAGADETTRAYYDFVLGWQEDVLRDPLTYVTTLIMLAGGGTIPDTWTIGFRSLWVDDQKAQMEARKEQSEIDKTYVEMGALDAVLEVRPSRFGGDEFSHEMELDEDITKELEELRNELLEMGIKHNRPSILQIIGFEEEEG